MQMGPLGVVLFSKDPFVFSITNEDKIIRSLNHADQLTWPCLSNYSISSITDHSCMIRRAIWSSELLGSHMAA